MRHCSTPAQGGRARPRASPVPRSSSLRRRKAIAALGLSAASEERCSAMLLPWSALIVRYRTKRTPSRDKPARERGRALIGCADFGLADGCKKACGQLWVGGTLIVLHVLINGEPSGRLVAGRLGRGVERMNTYGSTSLFGMLMATSLVSGATAMEINQQRAPATSDAPAFTLPAFLDGARLPDLQDAWRAHFGDTSGAAAVQPASERHDADAEAALDAAQQAMTRAEQASREAAAVRVRAEELSRRFGAGGERATGTGSVRPRRHRSIRKRQCRRCSAAGRRARCWLRPTTSAAPAAASAATDDAPVIEDMATKPAKPVKRIQRPDLRSASPCRRRRIRAPQSPADLLKVDPAAPKPEIDPMLPNELRAFGWNAQP